MRKIKAFLVDVINGKAEAVEIDAKLESYYKLLECEYIDITERKFGGKYYDIICDDEGLLKERRIISVINSNNEAMLVGNLLICNHEGANESSLTDEDIKQLQECVKWHITIEGIKPVVVCEY